MNPDILIAHPYLAAGLVALFANLCIVGVTYGLSGAARQHGRALQAWGRRTFTAAGDGCICHRWAAPIYCPTCDTTHVLTPTATIPTPPEVRERMRLHGLVEIQRGTVENLTQIDQHRRAAKAFSKIRRTMGAVN